MKRWALAVAAPLATGLYVRGFCALLDIRWGDGGQMTAAMLALVVAGLAAAWAGEGFA